MPDGVRQASAGGGVRVGLQFRHRALGNHAPAVNPGTRPQVDDVLGAADGVLVVLHHHDGVALAFQPAEGVQQHAVVPRVQADGGLVEDVAHPLQIGAQLGGDADALRLPAGERGRGPVQVQVGQPHLLQEVQPRADFRHDVLGHLGIPPGERQGLEAVGGLLHGERRVLGDVAFPEVDRQRLRLEPAPGAGPADTGFVVLLFLQPDGFLAALLGVETGQDHAGAVAGRAPAVLGVVGEQARIQFREAAPAARAGTLGGEDGLAGVGQELHGAVAIGQRVPDQPVQRGLVARRNVNGAHGQVNVVLLVAGEARPVGRGLVLAVHAQVLEALLAGPGGQVRVVALARHHHGRQQRGLLPSRIAQDAGADCLRGLLVDGQNALRAILGAQLDEQQPQEVVDLGHGGHGALAPAPAGALLDGDRGRDAEDGVHVRARGRLDELAGVGVEGFQVAALALVEDDVEGHGALARAGQAREHRELVARDPDVHVLQVVLARVVDGDGIRVAAVGRGRFRHHGLAVGLPGLPQVVPECLAGVACGDRHHLFRRAAGNQLPAPVTAFRAQVDQPVGGGHQVLVVLDHGQ